MAPDVPDAGGEFYALGRELASRVRSSGQRPARARVPCDLCLRTLVNRAPPVLPALASEESPPQISAQKAQLICTREQTAVMKAGEQAREVLQAPGAGQPSVRRDSNQVNEPRRLVREQDIDCLEIALGKPALVQGANKLGDMVNARAQESLAPGSAQSGDVSQVIMEVSGVHDFFSDQVAFVREQTPPPLKHRQGPRGWQQAFAKPMTVNPGAYGRCLPQQCPPRVCPALDPETFIDDRAKDAVDRERKFRHGRAGRILE